MKKFFERLFGGSQPEEPNRREVPPITERPLAYRDPNEAAWSGTAQGNIDRANRLEKNPVEEMRLKKGVLGAMLRQLIPERPWNEMDIFPAMTDSEIARLPSIDRTDRVALQEIADAIALRVRQEQMAREDEAEAAK